MRKLFYKSKSVIAAAIVHGTFNATAGLTGLYIEGYNDLLGAAGLPCILTFAVMDILLYIYDRYISKERIFSRPLSV